MSSFTTYKGYTVFDGTPTGSGGQALNNNFKATADKLEKIESFSTSSTIDTTTVTVDTFSITGVLSATWEYVVNDGTNYRAGRIQAVWNSDGSSVSFNETTTTDIGDTSGVAVVVDYNTGNIRLRFTTTSDDWNVNGNRYIIKS